MKAVRNLFDCQVVFIVEARNRNELRTRSPIENVLILQIGIGFGRKVGTGSVQGLIAAGQVS
jgi:hypothetical protein